MNQHKGLMITGHEAAATCVACSKPTSKECLYLHSGDGGFRGWVCFAHLKTVLRLSLQPQARPDGGDLLSNGTEHDDREVARA